MSRRVKKTTIVKTTRVTSKKRKNKRKRGNKMTGPFRAYIRNDPFPPTVLKRMHYETITTLAVGTAGVFGTEYVWRLNSLYDPDFSFGGHQPYGFDTMTSIYDRYIVYGVKMNLTFYDASQDGLIVGALINDSEGSETIQGKTSQYIGEQPMCVLRTLSSAGSQKTTISQYFSIAKLDGISKTTISANITEYGAAVTANPNLIPYVRTAIADSRDGSAGTCVVMMKLTFYAKFFNRKILSQS